MSPLYDYSCQCGTIAELITRHDEIPSCPECGERMKREFHSQFGINMGAAGAHGYYDEQLGCYIHTNRQRKEEMRKQGLSEKIGKGWY